MQGELCMQQVVRSCISTHTIFVVTFDAIPNLSSEPSQPQSVTTDVVNSTEVTLSWQPPAVPNGVITTYNVWYNVSLNCSGSLVSFTDSVGSSTRAYLFTGLEEYTPYVFHVSAETSAGEGMAAMAIDTTLEDGVCACMCVCVRVCVCMCV